MDSPFCVAERASRGGGDARGREERANNQGCRAALRGFALSPARPLARSAIKTPGYPNHGLVVIPSSQHQPGARVYFLHVHANRRVRYAEARGHQVVSLPFARRIGRGELR